MLLKRIPIRRMIAIALLFCLVFILAAPYAYGLATHSHVCVGSRCTVCRCLSTLLAIASGLSLILPTLITSPRLPDSLHSKARKHFLPIAAATPVLLFVRMND